eukprot:gene19507-19935_t
MFFIPVDGRLQAQGAWIRLAIDRPGISCRFSVSPDGCVTLGAAPKTQRRIYATRRVDFRFRNDGVRGADGSMPANKIRGTSGAPEMVALSSGRCLYFAVPACEIQRKPENLIEIQLDFDLASSTLRHSSLFSLEIACLFIAGLHCNRSGIFESAGDETSAAAELQAAFF